MFFCLILKYLRFIYFPSVYSVSSVVNSYIQIYKKENVNRILISGVW